MMSKLINAKNRFFHITPKNNLNSILAKGLIPQIGPRSQEINEPEPTIFLFSQYEEMETALANWLGECFDDTEELIILQIDCPKTFPITQLLDSNGDTFYESYCYCDIPAQYITHIYDEYYNIIEPKDSKG